MPGAMHKMGVYLGLVEDNDKDWDAGYDEYGDSEYAGGRRAERADYDEPRYARAEHSAGRVAVREYAEADVDIDGYADEPVAGYQITTLHPRTYNEARTIGEHFRRNTPVIMNLSDMDDADAKRLVDFAAGLTFGRHGRIERVTAKVFLLSPQNVQVTAADKARFAESGFFNQS